LSIVDPATGDVCFNPNFGSSGAVCCIAYTRKGDVIGVGLSRGLVKVTNTATGVHHDLRQLDGYEMVDLRDPHRPHTPVLAYEPHGEPQAFVVGYGRGRLQRIDAESGSLLHSTQLGSRLRVCCITFTPRGYIAVGCEHGRVHIVDPMTLAPFCAFGGPLRGCGPVGNVNIDCGGPVRFIGTVAMLGPAHAERSKYGTAAMHCGQKIWGGVPIVFQYYSHAIPTSCNYANIIPILAVPILCDISMIPARPRTIVYCDTVC